MIVTDTPSFNTNPFYVKSGWCTADGRPGLNPCILGNNEGYRSLDSNLALHKNYIDSLTLESWGGTYSDAYKLNEIKLKGRGRPYKWSVVPNCVGLACGAFNETYCKYTWPDDRSNDHCKYALTSAAGSLVNLARNNYKDLPILNKNDDPPEGGLAVWSNSENGHVAYIYLVTIDSKGDVIGKLLESGWSGEWCRKSASISKSNGYTYPGHENKNDDDPKKLKFVGFIANPAVTGSYVSTGAFVGNSFSTPFIFDGSIWKKATPYIFNGSEWKKCKR